MFILQIRLKWIYRYINIKFTRWVKFIRFNNYDNTCLSYMFIAIWKLNKTATVWTHGADKPKWIISTIVFFVNTTAPLKHTKVNCLLHVNHKQAKYSYIQDILVFWYYKLFSEPFPVCCWKLSAFFSTTFLNK